MSKQLSTILVTEAGIENEHPDRMQLVVWQGLVTFADILEQIEKNWPTILVLTSDELHALRPVLEISSIHLVRLQGANVTESFLLAAHDLPVYHQDEVASYFDPVVIEQGSPEERFEGEKLPGSDYHSKKGLDKRDSAPRSPILDTEREDGDFDDE
jgi:hypothetical protein